MPRCLVCDAPTRHFGRHLILGRYDAEYRLCTRCGYIFVPEPHWLPEAYGTAITALDTGIVARNLWLADAACVLLAHPLRHVSRIVDYGGGTGLFVRLMRDRGHDVHWHDAYSPNLLALGFEANLEEAFDLATAFELVEHLPDPVDGFTKLASLASHVLLSTDLIPDPAPSLDAWPYFAPEAGQHIGFFTVDALEVIAERLGLQLSTNARNLHVLAPKRLHPRWLKLVRRAKRARLLARFSRKASLTYSDADLMYARLWAAQRHVDPPASL